MKNIFCAIVLIVISITVSAQKQIDKFEYSDYKFTIFETTDNFGRQQEANDGSSKIIKEDNPIKRTMYKICGYKKGGEEINCISEVMHDEKRKSIYSREGDVIAFVTNYKSNTKKDKSQYRLIQYLIVPSGKIASVSSNYGMVKYFDDYPALNTFEAQFLKTDLSLLDWKTTNFKYKEFFFEELVDYMKVISFEIEIKIDDKGKVHNEFVTFLRNNKAISAPIVKKLQALIAPKITKMPDWIPARENGTNVASVQTIDITIFPGNSNFEAKSK